MLVNHCGENTVRFATFWILLVLASSFTDVSGQTFFDGGVLRTNYTFGLASSPYVVRNDIKVSQGVTLTVQPGVELRFEPRTRLLIEGGTLIASGTPTQRIRFVRNRDPPQDTAIRYASASQWSDATAVTTVTTGTLRLVNGIGAETRLGQLQMRLAGRWRSVCSNGRLWSARSSLVACRQLGFADGNFTFADYALNNTYVRHEFFMQLAEPNCSGAESNLIECEVMQSALKTLQSQPGEVLGLSNNQPIQYPAGFSIGFDVCDSQYLVGLQCWGVANNSAFSNNWHGIVFANSSSRELVFSERDANLYNVKMNISASLLQYVDISGAGVNASGHSVAALSASPLVPHLRFVRVFNNAYDGANFTEIKSPLFVTDSQFEGNNGVGMNVSTAVGYVRLERVRAALNGGDGVRVKLLNRYWLDVELADKQQLLCQPEVSGSTVYPLYVRAAGIDPRGSMIGASATYEMRRTCQLSFYAAYGQVLTVSVSQVKLDPNSSAVIRIYDMIQVNQPVLISEWFFDKVRYFQSVTSRANSIRIEMNWYKPSVPAYCVTLRECVDILMFVHADVAVHRQVAVFDSDFSGNAQRGLTLVDMSGFLYVNASRFIENQFDAGFKLLNGSADLLLNASVFERNEDCGLNVSYSGGYRSINSTVFRANRGYGARIGIVDDPELRTRENAVQRTDFYLSNFIFNQMASLRVSNSCYSHSVLVNFSRFEGNLREAIQVVSCEREQVGRRTDLFAREYIATFESFVSATGTALVPFAWCEKLGPLYSGRKCGTAVVRGLQFSEMTNFTVAFSEFYLNKRESIYIVPATNLNGTVRNSTFRGNSMGVINIDNSDDPLKDRIYAKLPVYYSVESNRMEQNSGEFVINARLTHISTYQSLTVLYNTILNNSAWRVSASQGTATSRLSTRNRVRAIVVASSSNVKVQRNWLENSGSLELGTQLRDASVSVDVSLNFWGVPSQLSSTSWDAFYRDIMLTRLFDGASRYNLAMLRFWPVLKTNDLLSVYSTTETPTYRVEFIRGTTIGGSLDSSLGTVQTLRRGTYLVDRDIIVPFNFRLTIEAGTRLQFANSVGMLVQGQVIVQAPFEPDRITLTVEPTMAMQFHFPATFGTPSSDLPQQPIVRIVPKGQPSNEYVYEGLAQINLATLSSTTPVWGTICNRGWSLREAIVFCGQLGLIARVAQLPKIVSADAPPDAESNTPIHISSVRCNQWSRSLLDCEADYLGEHSCTHDEDVFIQCFAPGWAGVRFAVSAQPSSTLQYVSVTHAGMFDAQSAQFMAGIQIDYNRHNLNNLIVSENRADGLLITHADAFGRLSLINSVFERNLDAGIGLRSPYLTVTSCAANYNQGAGLRYDPSISEVDAYAIQSVITNVVDLVQCSPLNSCSIQQDGFTYFRISRNAQNESNTLLAELSASTSDPNYRAVLELIDFNPRTTEERVIIYDGRLSEVRAGTVSFWWRVPEDLVAFPIVSTGRYLTVSVATNGIRSGRFLFVAQSRSFVGDSTMSVTMARTTGQFVPARLSVGASQFSWNGYGAALAHYNDPADLVLERQTLFFRRKREEFLFSNTLFEYNRAEAVYARSLSRFASLDSTQYVPPSNFSFLMFESSAKLSFVNYSFSAVNLTFNNRVIRFDHDQIEYANVVYNWTIANSQFLGNGPYAAVWLEMPFLTRRADRAESNRNHVVNITRNNFIQNAGLKVSIRGYFAEVAVTQNLFDGNDCNNLGGVLQLYGMEKKYIISKNFFYSNIECLFAIETRINSQTESSKAVIGSVDMNTITDNSCFATFLTGTDYELMNTLVNLTQPTCYAIGVFGIQAPSVTRNVLQNSAYPSELVGGFYNTIDLGTVLNATMNYWGTTEIETIPDRIFDFDDWNSFAFVDYSKFLLAADALAPNSDFVDTDPTTLTGGESVDLSRTRVLGGHITQMLTLRARPDAYVVRSDLTIMPDKVLTIEAGVRLEFFPNVGLLVLGRLIVRGSPFNPVRFESVQPSTVRGLLKDGTLKIPVESAAARRRRAATQKRVKRQFTAPSWTPSSVSGYDSQSSLPRGRVTLSTDTVRLIGGNQNDEGFLEFWNATAQHWSLACDSQYSEESARVTCRELRNSTDEMPMNVEFRFSSLYDSQVFGYDNAYVSKDVWRTSYSCIGTEHELVACAARFNYAWQSCSVRKEYVFLRCADAKLNTPLKFWGSVRFGNTAYEYSKRVVPTSFQGYLEAPYDSVINYLQITGAGFLHNERTSAVLSVLETPNIRYTKIKNCSASAVTYIAPVNGITFFNNTLTDNQGYGLGVLMLNGDTRVSLTEAPAFVPLVDNTIPHGAFGLVSMCDTQKFIKVRDRLVVYFRYSFSQQQRTMLCTKLFKSEIVGRPLVLRFLQLSLVYEPFQKNAVELFSGEYFNSTQMLAVIVPPSPSDTLQQQSKAYDPYAVVMMDPGSVNSALNAKIVPQAIAGRRAFKTELYDSLGVNVYASTGRSTYGFIAEIVTVSGDNSVSPDAYPKAPSEVGLRHQVQQSRFERNQGGGVRYQQVGRSNPPLEIYLNQFAENGVRILNMSSPSALNIEMQSAQRLTVLNNYIGRNFGGLRITTWNDQLMEANVSNNAITENSNDNALFVSSNGWCKMAIVENWIVNNLLEMRSVVRLDNVRANFSRNTIFRNVGGTILNVSMDDRVSFRNDITANGFYENYATNYTRHSTAYITGSSYLIERNYFLNELNDFELQTANMSTVTSYLITAGSYACGTDPQCAADKWVLRDQSRCVCYRDSPIDAKRNWWGWNTTSFIRARIHDWDDDNYLVPVDYTNYFVSNSSVIEGYCPPTWTAFQQRCFRFVGGPLTYTQAKRQCERDGAVMADSRGAVSVLTDLMRRSQLDYDSVNRFAIVSRAWVFTARYIAEDCPVVRNYYLESFPCDTPLPYFCERSVYVTMAEIDPLVIIVCCAVLACCFVIVLIFILMQYAKSQRRKIEGKLRKRAFTANIVTAKKSETQLTGFNVTQTQAGSNVGSGSYIPISGERAETMSQMSGPASTGFTNFTESSKVIAARNYIQKHAHTMSDDDDESMTIVKSPSGSVSTISAPPSTINKPPPRAPPTLSPVIEVSALTHPGMRQEESFDLTRPVPGVRSAARHQPVMNRPEDRGPVDIPMTYVAAPYDDDDVTQRLRNDVTRRLGFGGIEDVEETISASSSSHSHATSAASASDPPGRPKKPPPRPPKKHSREQLDTKLLK